MRDGNAILSPAPCGGRLTGSDLADAHGAGRRRATFHARMRKGSQPWASPGASAIVEINPPGARRWMDGTLAGRARCEPWPRDRSILSSPRRCRSRCRQGHGHLGDGPKALSDRLGPRSRPPFEPWLDRDRGGRGARRGKRCGISPGGLRVTGRGGSPRGRVCACRWGKTDP